MCSLSFYKQQEKITGCIVRICCLASVAHAVIQAIGRTELEDGTRTRVRLKWLHAEWTEDSLSPIHVSKKKKKWTNRRTNQWSQDKKMRTSFKTTLIVIKTLKYCNHFCAPSLNPNQGGLWGRSIIPSYQVETFIVLVPFLLDRD